MNEDPLIRLREQLVAAADRRAEERAAAGSRRGRGRGRRRGAWLTLAALLIGVPAAATGAGLVEFGQSAKTQGAKIALQAVRETAALPACGQIDFADRPRFATGEPLPEITALLPSLASPVPRASQTRALAQLPHHGGLHGHVLRDTIRTIALPGAISLLVYIQQGAGLSALRDPAACGEARSARAEQLLGDRPDAVRRWAEQRLADRRDTEPHLQTLVALARVRGDNHRSGSGSPVRPGQPLRAGVLSSGGAGRGRSVYVGVASPRAAYLTVRRTRGGAMAGVPARVAVRQGFFAFTLPGSPRAMRRTPPTGSARRSRSGAARRWARWRRATCAPTPPAWRSFAWRPSRVAAKRCSRRAGTPMSWPISWRSSTRTRCASVCAGCS